MFGQTWERWMRQPWRHRGTQANMVGLLPKCIESKGQSTSKSKFHHLFILSAATMFSCSVLVLHSEFVNSRTAILMWPKFAAWTTGWLPCAALGRADSWSIARWHQSWRIRSLMIQWWYQFLERRFPKQQWNDNDSAVYGNVMMIIVTDHERMGHTFTNSTRVCIIDATAGLGSLSWPHVPAIWRLATGFVCLFQHISLLALVAVNSQSKMSLAYRTDYRL